MGKWMIPWNSFYGLKVLKVCPHQPRLCAAIISSSHFVCVIACNDSFKSALCRWFTFKSLCVFLFLEFSFVLFFWDSGRAGEFLRLWNKKRFAARPLQSASIFALRFMLCVNQLTHSGASVRGDEGPNCLFCLKCAVQGSGLRTDCVMGLCQI